MKTMKNTNEKYFKTLINEHRLLILKVCSTFHPDEASQKDLYQDICINIWKGLPGFRGNSSISTWLYRVSLNTALSQGKRHHRDPLRHAVEINEHIEYERTENKEEKINALYAGIALLRPMEKALIMLYLEEKSYEEISEIMGITSKNVSVKLVRIKRTLETHVKNILSRGGKK